MQFDTSQQISATYARNHFKEVMDKTRDEGAQIIIHKSEPAVIIMRLDDFEKLKNPSAKPKKHKKFNLEEIRKNSTFSKYVGCMKDMYPGLTSVQLQKQWAKYVD